MLILRTCDENLQSYNGFQWPKKGKVICSDWKPEPKCGNGLHGLPWGEGDGGLMNWDASARWLVVEVPDKLVVPIDAKKVKFPKGIVLFCGDREAATQFLLASGGAGRAIAGLTIQVGDRKACLTGYRGTATAGYRGTATAGYRGTATAGEYGTATAGEYGTATAGEYGTATAGEYGTATAGNGGLIEIAYWDGVKNRKRINFGYIGENGLLENVAYRLDDTGNFVEVPK
jgi:hypothetical protein